MFGKSASSITDYLITSDEFDPETCQSFLQKSLKKKADAAVKSTATPYCKNKCERLAKRRGKKRTIIAITRMILTAVYQMSL